jgi:mono/diheme cytochrome c family protein
MICQELTSSDHPEPDRAMPAIQLMLVHAWRGLRTSLAFDRTLRSLSILLAFLLTSVPVATAEPIDYAKQIKPIFTARCTHCHGALKQEGGLRLDTGALARQGGDDGKVITPGDVASSDLMKRITSSDTADRMPQEGEPLTATQIAAIREWITHGASSPADEKPDRDPREHWSFRPIVRPPVPKVSNPAWVRNPIDAFIAANHQRQGLTPQLEATRSELVRRLYLDLIGLPPNLEQINEAESDRAADWYERLTDKLLDSPQHGECWARHWMDIWRYSDWWGLGDQLRNSQPHIWHWRDWIVESLNANVPYDEMVRSMLAADELYPNDLKKLRATGFLARQYFLFNRNSWLDETVEHVSKGFLGLTMNCAKCHDHKFDPIKQADYYRVRAFFEPYFVRLDTVPNEPDLTRDGIPRAFDGKPDAPTYLFVRGQETNPDKSKPLTPGVPEIFAFRELTIKPVPIPLEACQPERRPWVLKSYLEAATKKMASAESDLVAANERLAEASGKASSEKPASKANAKAAEKSSTTKQTDDVARARADVDASECEVTFAAAELCSVKSRADAMEAHWATFDAPSENSSLAKAERTKINKAIAAQRRAELAKAQFEVADAKRRLLRAPAEQKSTIEAELAKARESRNKCTKIADTPIGDNEHYMKLMGAQSAPTRFNSTTVDDETIHWSDHSTGRRKALAEWITDPRNPLAARVAVNHIWNRHMGTPLAPNPFDLGRNSPPPTNPALLDWLAAELIESGWDMKHLHRLIVTSATYRMSSEASGCKADIAIDSDNIYWWRRNPIRLDAEVIRDSVLSLAGRLDLTMGGPPVPTANEDDSHRRSIYFFHSNNERNLFLTTFDEALVTECYRRNQSIVPQQALAMTNSRLVLDSAKPIAEQISKSISHKSSEVDDAAFIRSAFLLMLANPPNDVEFNTSQEAIEKWRELPKVSSQDARSYLVWSLLNHNDFVTMR